MNVKSRALLYGVFLLSMGCTKGVPDFSTLDESSVPQPLFSGSTTKVILVGSANALIPVSGECDPKITDLLAIPVGVASPSSLSSYVTGAITVACSSTGTFSFTLSSLSAIGFSIVDNSIYEIQLRGVTSGGISRASTIRLSFAQVGKPQRVYITSGSNESNAVGARRVASATYQAEIRLGHMSNNALTNMNEAIIKSSATYKFKGGAAATND